MFQVEKRVLIAEKDTETRQKLSSFLREIGFQTETVSDADQVRATLADHDYAVVLLDCRLAEDKSLSMLGDLTARYPEVSVIMMSGNPSLEVVISAMRNGAYDFVIKPFDLSELGGIIRKAYDRFELMKMYRAMSENMRREGVTEEGSYASVAATTGQ